MILEVFIEKWKTVKSAPNYEISNYGKVRRAKDNYHLKISTDRYGYGKIQLIRVDGSSYYTTIHRLVAIAFLDNPNGYTQVNHKDGIKLNNRYTNLEWCSAKYNVNHSYIHGLNNNRLPVVLEDLTVPYKKSFISVKEMCRYLNMKPSVVIPYIRFSHNIVFGLSELVKIINVPHDIPFSKMSVSYLNSLLNAPHESVERLNKIVDFKDKDIV